MMAQQRAVAALIIAEKKVDMRAVVREYLNCARRRQKALDRKEAAT